MKDLKELYPVETAEYAVANKIIVEEPAFAWWAPKVLRKRDEGQVSLLEVDSQA